MDRVRTKHPGPRTSTSQCRRPVDEHADLALGTLPHRHVQEQALIVTSDVEDTAAIDDGEELGWEVEEFSRRASAERVTSGHVNGHDCAFPAHEYQLLA